MAKDVVWAGSNPTRCQLCGGPYSDNIMYDARIPAMGSWGNICQSCFYDRGCSLGTGKGQKYKLQDDGKWHIVRPARGECTRELYPELFQYLGLYGLDDNIISRIDRIKGNEFSGYHVVGWKNDDGSIDMLDISNTPDHGLHPELRWNMLNDGMSPSITEDDWKKLQLDEACEHFTIPGHEEYGE